MRNLTVSIPDDVYRTARIRAAERGSSVSALVGEFLRTLSAAESEYPLLEAQQRRIQEEIAAFRASDRLGRDAVHARGERASSHDVAVSRDERLASDVQPPRARGISGVALLGRWRQVPGIDPAAFRHDVDDAVDQSL